MTRHRYGVRMAVGGLFIGDTGVAAGAVKLSNADKESALADRRFFVAEP